MFYITINNKLVLLKREHGFILIAKRIDLLKGFGADGCLVLSYGFTTASLCSLTISTF